MPRCAYPEPQYTLLFTTVAPEITEDPATKFHRVLPVEASKANRVGAVAVPSMDSPYTTPLAAVKGPRSTAPLGSGTCHSIAPVAGFSAEKDSSVPIRPRAIR